MGSDNHKRPRSDSSASLLCRVTVAVLGIALLLWFAVRARHAAPGHALPLTLFGGAPQAEPATPIVPSRHAPRKLISEDRGARHRKATHARVQAVDAPAPAVAEATVDEHDTTYDERAFITPEEDDTELASEARGAAEESGEGDGVVANAAAVTDADAARAPPPARAREDLPPARGLYRFTLTDIDGDARPLREFAGRVTLLMNVASACGYTDANYKGAQALYDTFKERGFAVLAVPCNCFGSQEPGSDEEIKRFATQKYGVTFPLFSKVANVNGPDAAPVFDWVRLQPGFDAEYTWNFNKVLIGANGKPVKRYGPAWDDDDMRADVEAQLAVPFEDAEPF